MHFRDGYYDNESYDSEDDFDSYEEDEEGNGIGEDGDEDKEGEEQLTVAIMTSMTQLSSSIAAPTSPGRVQGQLP
jgi:hypothetical protein